MTTGQFRIDIGIKNIEAVQDFINKMDAMNNPSGFNAIMSAVGEEARQRIMDRTPGSGKVADMWEIQTTYDDNGFIDKQVIKNTYPGHKLHLYKGRSAKRKVNFENPLSKMSGGEFKSGGFSVHQVESIFDIEETKEKGNNGKIRDDISGRALMWMLEFGTLDHLITPRRNNPWGLVLRDPDGSRRTRQHVIQGTRPRYMVSVTGTYIREIFIEKVTEYYRNLMG
jgi:hypothetical protein